MMSLPNLRTTIEDFPDLGEAFILASECYVTSSVVRHRYILLELHHNSQVFWIRMERLRVKNGLARFFLAAATSPARDTVRGSL